MFVNFSSTAFMLEMEIGVNRTENETFYISVLYRTCEAVRLDCGQCKSYHRSRRYLMYMLQPTVIDMFTFALTADAEENDWV